MPVFSWFAHNAQRSFTMIRFVIFLACIAVADSKQNCYSCTSAKNAAELFSWNMPNWRGNYIWNNGGSDNCNKSPWAASGTVSCTSMCYKWQNIYSSGGQSIYQTVRGCADEMLNSGIPGNEQCRSAQNNQNGLTGTSYTCFCNGDNCNPATKTTAFGTGAVMLIALMVRMYQ